MPKLTPEMEWINLLVEHEELLHMLYDEFAETVPEYRDLWIRLSREETEHVGLIRLLENEMPSGDIILDISARIDQIREAIRYTQTVVEHSRRYAPTPHAALMIALDLEGSFVERNLLAMFHGQTAAIQRVMDQLETTFQDHIALIRRVEQGKGEV